MDNAGSNIQKITLKCMAVSHLNSLRLSQSVAAFRRSTQSSLKMRSNPGVILLASHISPASILACSRARTHTPPTFCLLAHRVITLFD